MRGLEKFLVNIVISEGPNLFSASISLNPKNRRYSKNIYHMDLTNLDEDGNSGGIASPYLQSQKVSTFVTESSFKLEVSSFVSH